MSIREVVTCFVEHRGRLLVLRRSQKVRTYPGRWAAVSGSIEGASALEQAFKEIAEETCLGPEDVELLSTGEPLKVVDEGLAVTWLVHPFLFRVGDPSRVRLDWEHSQSRWISPDELSQLNTVPRLKETWERLFITPEVARGIDEIRNDREHGATFLGGEALRVLALAAEALPTAREYMLALPALKVVGRELTQARPAMAAIKNMVGRFVAEMESSGEELDPHALERQLLGEMEAASREAAMRAAELVYDSARVITCSYSSAVLRTFRTAMALGKGFSVVAVVSRAGDLAYGQRLLEEVSDLGIAAGLATDAAVAEAVSSADMALVGADKLLPDGSIVNGRPTLELAQRARGAIPFYVVGESFKLDTDPNVEEGFDLVPASLITRVIMDT